MSEVKSYQGIYVVREHADTVLGMAGAWYKRVTAFGGNLLPPAQAFLSSPSYSVEKKAEMKLKGYVPTYRLNENRRASNWNMGRIFLPEKAEKNLAEVVKA